MGNFPDGETSCSTSLGFIHGVEVLFEGDLCLLANLVPGLGVWHHLNHPTLQGEGQWCASWSDGGL